MFLLVVEKKNITGKRVNLLIVDILLFLRNKNMMR